jgi:hypothetical protein
VGLELSPLSLVIIIEELLERKSSGSGLESREYGRRNPSCWPHGALYPQKLAPTLLTSGGRSVGIVHSHTQAMEFILGNELSSIQDRNHSHILTRLYQLHTEMIKFVWLKFCFD